MAKESSEETDELKEVTLEYILISSKDYLPQGPLKCLKFEQDHISKIKALRRKQSFET